MRTKLLLCLLAGISFCASAQTINVVSNPNAPGIFAWSGTGALSGYAGNPIILNNKLVLEYNPSAVSDPSAAGFQLQLAVYDGNSYQLIPNPDNGPGVYYQSVQLVFDGKLYFIYLNNAGTQQLASFDGSAITLYPNPDAGLGYIGSPRVLNNSLYGAYSNASGVTQFAKFTGAGLSLISNPDNSSIGFYNNYSVVYDGKIVSRYVTAAGPKKLATFDGTSWTVLPNPDNTTRGVTPVFPALYHSKLYFRYYSATNQYQYLAYDGTNNPSLIANPQNSGVNDGGVVGFPIVYNDTLFLQYFSTANTYQLAKFDGTAVSLVPNPDNSPNGYYNVPVVYNNNLYLFYVTPDGLHHLAQYQAASSSLKLYPNPDGGFGYWDQPLVHAGKLFFLYYNAQSQLQLGYFDGNAIKRINNPAGQYNGAAGNNGYTGSPIVFNNLLYMQFGSVPYANAGNLASFDASTLPVNLLRFDGKLNGSEALLTWSTATETNNKGFAVEKSSDGKGFNAIGFVNGHGNSTDINTYSYTDEKLAGGANYYRLKQVDNDGNFRYSSVIRLDYTGFHWSVSGNGSGNARLQLQLNRAAAVAVQIASVNGSLVQTINKGNLPAGIYVIPLDLTTASRGMYVVKLIVDNTVYTAKLVK